MKAIWSDNTPYSKILISVGIILICAITFTLIGMWTATLIYGISMVELDALIKNYSHPLSISILKLMQTFSAIGTFLAPPLILAYLFSARPSAFLCIDRKPKLFSIITVIVIMIVAGPVINFLGELNLNMNLPEFLKRVEEWMREAEDKAAGLTKSFLKMDSPSDLLVNLIVIGLIPAIGEELLFRGIVQKLFQQWWKNIHLAIWMSAILFSAMHLQFYGFLPRMLLGGLLGYLLVWSGSLWLPIIAHFINNAAAVIFIYLFQNGITSIDPDKIGTGNDIPSLGGSILFTIVLLVVLYKNESGRSGNVSAS